MTPLRKKRQEQIYKDLKQLVPVFDNAARYERFFARLSDKQFDEWLQDVAEGKQYFHLCLPHQFHEDNPDNPIDFDALLELSEKWGQPFLQRLWITDPGIGRTYLTPIPHLVLLTSVRRAAQTVTKKASIPPHNRVVNTLSGQPTGESASARFSYPETSLAVGAGWENTAVEFLKYRGGDLRGYAAMNQSLANTGRASMRTLAQFASGVESVKTLKTFFNAAHLRVSL